MSNNQEQVSMQWTEYCQGGQEVAKVRTPAGNFALYARGSVLIKAEWVPNDNALQQPESEFLINLQQQVKQYWQNEHLFKAISVLNQGTEFHQRVWRNLCAIPYGETITYMALAKQLDSSPRAIGGACRHNPYPLFIPCHRVISTSGIGGYAGQTDGLLLNIKQRLLDHEAGVIK